jgi:hypothetical protein
MSKKKLKKMMKAAMSQRYDGAVPTEGLPEFHNVLGNHCEQQYTIYRMQNGFAVAAYTRKRDNMGNTTQHNSKVIYVEKLTDLPTVLAANGAADAMGVKY